MQIDRVKQILERFDGKTILVMGDLMLDHYIWGTVDRISPEAPVPVVLVDKEEYRLGGAANVVNNLRSLGAKPYVFGAVGNDHCGDLLIEKFIQNNIITDFIFKDSSRKTTVKSRIIAHKQQVVRVDKENITTISSELENRIIETFKSIIGKVDAILFEDYNKGFLTENLIEKTINIASEANKIITVDPKYQNFFSFKKATVFKPNLIEFEKNMGIDHKNDVDYNFYAKRLMKQLNIKNLILTRGEQGLTVYQKDGENIKIPTFARDVYDVSGAGDTVISALTLCLSAGSSMKEAANISNHAAGIVCGKVGITSVRKDEIIKSFLSYHKEE